MGFFGKSNKHPKQENGTTMINTGTSIKGAIQTEGSLFIDGEFQGGIVAQGTITVGVNGKVIGEIKVDDIVINGLVDGIIYAKNVTVLASGKLLGKVQYENLKIEQNGVFQGEGILKDSNLVSQYNNIEVIE